MPQQERLCRKPLFARRLNDTGTEQTPACSDEDTFLIGTHYRPRRLFARCITSFGFPDLKDTALKISIRTRPGIEAAYHMYKFFRHL